MHEWLENIMAVPQSYRQLKCKVLAQEAQVCPLDQALTMALKTF